MIAVGAAVGSYLLTGELGRGGMGVVFTARHTLLDRAAAVKILRPELSRDQVVVGRFFNEARAASSIRHPGIVEIYDFGFHASGAAFIVMEMLDGEALSARMERGRRPLVQWWPVVRGIAAALAAAHAKQIVHRDLKPDNVFLVPDPDVPGGERPKLLDFGVAKLAAEPGAMATAAGALIGTPTYMAPEQCRGVAVDHRADLYSLGCIVFELLTGEPPFVGAGYGDVLSQHIFAPPPALAPRGVPAPVVGFVERLLAKQPDARFASAQAVVAAIDELARHPALGATPAPVDAFAPTRVMVTPGPTVRLPTPAGSEAATTPTVALVTPAPVTVAPAPRAATASPTTLGRAVVTRAHAASTPRRRGWVIGTVALAGLIAGAVALMVRGGGAGGTGRSNDAAVANDATVLGDAAVPVDATVLNDAALLNDTAEPVDAAVPDDPGAAIDVSPPPPRPQPPAAPPRPRPPRPPTPTFDEDAVTNPYGGR